MSTLDGPIWSKYSIELTYPARSHFQRTLRKDKWIHGWDEPYRSREEEGGDEDGHVQGGEGRRQMTNFRETVCCISAVVQGAARQKNGSRRVPGVTGTLGKANSLFDPTQTRSENAPPH